MYTGITIRKNQYYDSVFLMGFNNRISKMSGVLQTAVLMGSDANKEVLFSLGYRNPNVESSSANDLVVAVTAESQTILNHVLSHLDEWLMEVSSDKTHSEIRTLAQALQVRSDANLVVISVPGEFAAHETRQSLEAGKHVFLFSDNVSIQDEVNLKELAFEKGLLLMGPDCGTSLIGGIGIGFANSVRRGNIGVIAAAGTGLQEFTCMVHNSGFGISHAIGTGGRDLSDPVGGLTTLTALDALENDSDTEVIAIISKPPGEKTLVKLIERIKTCQKPLICCFLGIENSLEGEGVYFQRAHIIDKAVQFAIQTAGTPLARKVQQSETEYQELTPLRKTERKQYLRGIFAGGTFCYQSQQILQEAGIVVYSNAPLDKKLKVSHPDQSRENTIIDMGDEYFMVGRPHPMINGSQRALRILKEAQDPDVAILLLDFILGYNSSPDPVGELIDAIIKAKEMARQRGRDLEVVASLCGTDEDPQSLEMQTQYLLDAGVKVFRSNAQATLYCVSRLPEAKNG